MTTISKVLLSARIPCPPDWATGPARRAQISGGREVLIKLPDETVRLAKKFGLRLYFAGAMGV